VKQVASITCPFTSRQLKEVEMGMAYYMHDRRRRAYTTLVGNLKGTDYLGDLGLNMRIFFVRRLFYGAVIFLTT
jgi:hypothetical protein